MRRWKELGETILIIISLAVVFYMFFIYDPGPTLAPCTDRPAAEQPEAATGSHAAMLAKENQ